MGEAVERLIALTQVTAHVRHEEGKLVDVHAYSRLGGKIKASTIARGTIFHHQGQWYRAHSSAKPVRIDRKNKMGFKVPTDTGVHVVHVAKIDVARNQASGYHEIRIPSNQPVHLPRHAATKHHEREGWSTPKKQRSQAGTAFRRRHLAIQEFRMKYPGFGGGSGH